MKCFDGEIDQPPPVQSSSESLWVVHAPNSVCGGSLSSAISWATNHRNHFDQRLLQSGAILFRGFRAIDSAKAFAAFISTFATSLLDYVGGTSPRHKIHGKIHSSTDLERHFPIEPHQEMSYQTDFPDRVAFFCKTPAKSGGETPIVDMRRVYQALSAELVNRFASKGLRLRRRFPLKPGYIKVMKGWQTTFQTDSIPELERIVEQQGGSLVITKSYLEVENAITPAWITHPVTQEPIWFNQAHLLHTSLAAYWAKCQSGWMYKLMPFFSPIVARSTFTHYVYGDRSEIDVADLDVIRTTIRDRQILFQWQKSDVLLLENRIMAHGRRPFVGPRDVFAALIRHE